MGECPIYALLLHAECRITRGSFVALQVPDDVQSVVMCISSVPYTRTIATAILWSSHPGLFKIRYRVNKRRTTKIRANIVIAICTPRSCALRVAGSTSFSEGRSAGGVGDPEGTPGGETTMTIEMHLAAASSGSASCTKCILGN